MQSSSLGNKSLWCSFKKMRTQMDTELTLSSSRYASRVIWLCRIKTWAEILKDGQLQGFGGASEQK